MTLFNEAITTLGATFYNIYTVNKKDSNIKSTIRVYGLFIDNPAKSMSIRKDLVSEGYSSLFFSQVYIDDKLNKNYLQLYNKYWFITLQSNYYQKPLNQTLDHYEYALREVVDDLENITN